MQTSSGILSCDWGTSSLRLRLVDVAQPPRILAEYRSAQGVATLAAASQPQDRAGNFQRVLGDAIDELARRSNQSLDLLPVIISGMASSSIGWISLPYARLPFDLSGTDVVSARVNVDARQVMLISGVRDELDVMRGEETELIGLAQLPQAQPLLSRCTAILPGTHSKHVDIVDGKITAFRTLMTGELFSVLAAHSVLRHSVGGGQPVLPHDAAGPARDAFADGVRQAMHGDLLASLFRVRTRQLLQDQPAALNAAWLSGLLIGSEITALARGSAADHPILLCAGSAVAGWYAAAVDVAGLSRKMMAIPPEIVDTLSVLGHGRVMRHLADA